MGRDGAGSPSTKDDDLSERRITREQPLGARLYFRGATCTRVHQRWWSGPGSAAPWRAGPGVFGERLIKADDGALLAKRTSAWRYLAGPKTCADWSVVKGPRALTSQLGSLLPPLLSTFRYLRAATSLSAARRAPEMFREEGPSSSSAKGPET